MKYPKCGIYTIVLNSIPVPRSSGPL
uniref:Uncharacterized protein n=1 Tax=Anguilla anguilla TaxID=7936 RepID=A0A0E9STK0_ANGAN